MGNLIPMFLPCLTKLCNNDVNCHSRCSECCDMELDSQVHSEASHEFDVDVLGQHVHIKN